MSEQQFDEAVPEPSEQLDQLQREDTLIDRGVDDVLDEGYITPDDWSAGQREGAAPDEGETFDQRLKQEESDHTPDRDRDNSDDPWDWEQLDDHEVGRQRSGRLVATATEDGEDVESELIGEDVGYAGGAASAEEAAMHIIDDSDPDD